MLIINVILLFSFAFLGTRQVIGLFTGIFLKFVFSMLCVQWTKSGNKSAELMVNCGHLCDCYKSLMLDCFVWSIPSTFVKSFMYNSALYTFFFNVAHFGLACKRKIQLLYLPWLYVSMNCSKKTKVPDQILLNVTQTAKIENILTGLSLFDWGS